MYKYNVFYKGAVYLDSAYWFKHPQIAALWHVGMWYGSWVHTDIIAWRLHIGMNAHRASSFTPSLDFDSHESQDVQIFSSKLQKIMEYTYCRLVFKII